MTSKELASFEDLKSRIHTIRGMKVMLDRDLAELYQVETKTFNQSVKRNSKRFPLDFMFQLTREELDSLRSQIVTSKTQKQKEVEGGHSIFLMHSRNMELA